VHTFSPDLLFRSLIGGLAYFEPWKQGKFRSQQFQENVRAIPATTKEYRAV